jgi:hypothetical protein
MSQHEFRIEYDGDADRYDVSFRLTEATEGQFLDAIAMMRGQMLESGSFNEQTAELAYQVCEQTAKHPPWEDVEPNRVYDLALTQWQVGELSDALGREIRNAMSLRNAELAIELFTTWVDIIEQVRAQHDNWPSDPIEYSVIDTLLYNEFMAHETTEEPMVETEQIDRDGEIVTMEDEYDNRWTECLVCGRTFAGLDPDHEHDAEIMGGDSE